MSSSSDTDADNVAQKALREYCRLINQRPVLVKSITSGLIAALGDIVAQKIVISKSDSPNSFNWKSVASFAAYGCFASGPLIHYFYILLDKFVPRTLEHAPIKRVLVDRFILAPPYLLALFYCVGILEGQGHVETVKKIRETFWTALKMNWKIWTVFQYININYIPTQYRVLFANMISLGWNIYVAAKRK